LLEQLRVEQDKEEKAILLKIKQEKKIWHWYQRTLNKLDEKV
jgi:hypothetical protein